MPTPATTGTLKSNLGDMRVGDYITCKYVASSGAVGTFSELGTSVAAEIPVGGAAAPNGTFYFIKVDKGLLLADRVVQHTISWDALNTGRVIQGFPWDSGNVIPTMTSNITPSGTASASSEFGGSNNYYAWKAFDKNNTGLSRWMTISGEITGWLSFSHSIPKKVVCYSVGKGVGNVGSEPNSWTFEASNDGTNWTVLDTQIGQTNWADSEKRRYSINNKNEYLKYRINISKNNGGTYVQIGELEMFENAATIRSLTGGVAYLGTDGNLSTANKSLGAWPPNNDWDKYVVNFPTKKIQSGKSLDDVFHWNFSSMCWTQDTLSILVGVSTTRMLRGGTNSLINLNWLVSNTSQSSAGYRPVLEYKEV